MKVVILCGGKGTRLREETEYRPKPMVPIGGYPILWHIMKTYAHFGYSDFILCLGYKGEMIREYFRNYHWNTSDVTLKLGMDPDEIFHDKHDEENWMVTMAETGAESLTATRIRKIQKYIPEGEPFLLTYGDGLGSIDIKSSVESHRRSSRVCTTTAVRPAGRFGAMVVNSEGIVEKFEEKPLRESAYVNGGYMICQHELFDYLPKDDEMFEEGTISRLVAQGELNAFTHDGWWCPMDTFRESQHLNALWARGEAPWKVW
jgi:glucose-1-phosphate cytidylyltransferase